jgi:hypothetical protein
LQNELLNKIKEVVRNPPTIHILDQRRVACIFYNLFKENGRIDLGDIDMIMSGLPYEYSEYTKETIHDIPYLIQLLASCD